MESIESDTRARIIDATITSNSKAAANIAALKIVSPVLPVGDKTRRQRSKGVWGPGTGVGGSAVKGSSLIQIELGSAILYRFSLCRRSICSRCVLAACET